MAVSRLKGKYAPLDNTWALRVPLDAPEDIVPGGIRFASVEQAYHYIRVRDALGKLAVAGATDGADSKRVFGELRAQGVPHVADLDVRYQILLHLVRAKFVADEEAATLLVSTKGHRIYEGNPWGDDLWGVTPEPRRTNWVKGSAGQNLAGEILMQVRAELLAATPEQPMPGVADCIRAAFACAEAADIAQAQ